MCRITAGETSCTIKKKELNFQFMLSKLMFYESRRCCISVNGKHKHEEHIADRIYNSVSLYSWVHLPIPVAKAMRIPEAKVAVFQGRNFSKTILPAWQESKVRNKKEVIEKAHREGKTVHSFCHVHGLVPPQKFQMGQEIPKRTKGASY